jgi:hypothetical protein
MLPASEKPSDDHRQEIETILAEYQHQKMMESLVGPMVSMVVHVTVVVFLVFFISLDQPAAAPEVAFTMKQADEVKEADRPEPPEPPPEMEIPTIDVAAPAADSSGSVSSVSSFSDVGGQSLAIAPSASPYKVRVPPGSGAGVGFGSGGGTGMGGGSGGRPSNAMVGQLFVVRTTPAGQPNALGLLELANNNKDKELNDFYSGYVSPYIQYLERLLPVDPSQNWFCVPNKRLYSKAFFLPSTDSRLGPKLYEASSFIGPNGGNWLAHYAAVIPVARDMKFRFSGAGDNLLYVVVNHQLVHDGSINGNRMTYRPNERRQSVWITARRDEKLLVEIVVGESWGGLTWFNLWIEKDDKPGQQFLFATDELDEKEKALLASQGVPADRLDGGMINPSALDKFMRRLQEISLMIN